MRGCAGVDPYTAFLSGGEAVAVYAGGLHEDFGAPEVAADEMVGYEVCGGRCFGVMRRSKFRGSELLF